MDIGKRVKELRKKRGLTQAELARQSGVSYSFINEVEGGKKSVRLDRLNQLLSLFGYETGIVRIESGKNE
ncbi:MAG: helix-turn-helix transcriptional regulator [Deltaproteobacteria bacterium]|nr:helix-turn-helix transcriptional regulator [Deltaproteobacteria bacterium]